MKYMNKNTVEHHLSKRLPHDLIDNRNLQMDGLTVAYVKTLAKEVAKIVAQDMEDNETFRYIELGVKADTEK